MLTNRRNRLAAAINHSGLNKGEIAERAGMHRQVLTDILSGKIPGGKHLPAVSEVLGVTVDWIETGDKPPKWVKSSPKNIKTTSGATVNFLDVEREIGYQWRRLESTDPKRFDALASSLSEQARRALAVRGKPLSTYRLPFDDLLKLGEPFQLPGKGCVSTFEEGYRARQQDLEKLRRIRADGGGPALPLNVFMVCRDALLAMKGQRLALDQPWTEIKEALVCLWDRQKEMTGPKILKFELRDQDLGNS